jgi:uncharacterized protein (DUF362 family)
MKGFIAVASEMFALDFVASRILMTPLVEERII